MSVVQLNKKSSYQGIIFWNKMIQETFNFPNYFQILFNFMFLSFISPFWVSLGENQEVQLKEYLPQKVVCFLVHCLGWWGTFPGVRGSLNAQKIQNKPDIIFKLFSAVIYVSFIFPATKLFWRKKSAVKKLFRNVPRKKFSSVEMIGWSFLLPSVVILEVIIEAFYFALNPKTQVYSSTTFNKNSCAYAMNYLYGSFIISLLESRESCSAQPTGMQILLIVTQILQKYQTALTSALVVLSLTAAYSAHEIASGVLNLHKHTLVDVSTALTVHFKAKLIIGLIDDITRTSLFLSLLSCVSFLAQYVLEAIDEPATVLVCMLSFNCSLFVATMYYAAEANLKMKDSEKKIMQLYWNNKTDKEKNCCGFPARMIKDAPGANGLSCGRFFTVTYSFTAQCFSILLTYTIIKIQFEAAVSNSIAAI